MIRRAPLDTILGSRIICDRLAVGPEFREPTHRAHQNGLMLSPLVPVPNVAWISLVSIRNIYDHTVPMESTHAFPVGSPPDISVQPTIESLAPGVAVPIPMFPVFLCMRKS